MRRRWRDGALGGGYEGCMIAWMRAGRGRRGLMGLALLALWLKVMLPPGFMPATGGGALLAICTGHGPPAAAKSGKALPAGEAGKPCGFAGHALGPPGPPSAPVLAAPRAVFLAEMGGPTWRVVAPGRRLAAPPPPAQAPPVRPV